MVTTSATGGVSLLLQTEFDESIERLFSLLQTVERQYPVLARDMNGAVESLYSVYKQTTSKLLRSTHAHAMAEANFRDTQEELARERVARERIEAELTARAARLDALEAHLTSCSSSSSSSGGSSNRNGDGADAGASLLALRSELAALRVQMDDNRVWQARVHRMVEQRAAAEDEVAELRDLLMAATDRCDALKTELTGRIQQIQFIQKGMANTDSAAYRRLLSSLKQNTVKALGAAAANHAMFSPPATAARPPLGTLDATTSTGGANLQSAGTAGATGAEATEAKAAANIATSNQQASSSTIATTTTSARRAGSGYAYVRTITLERDGEGRIGFVVQGGAPDDAPNECAPAFVVDVDAKGLAARCGLLHVGDQLLNVGDTAVDTLTHSAMVDLIRAANPVVLTVASRVAAQQQQQQQLQEQEQEQEQVSQQEQYGIEEEEEQQAEQLHPTPPTFTTSATTATDSLRPVELASKFEAGSSNNVNEVASPPETMSEMMMATTAVETTRFPTTEPVVARSATSVQRTTDADAMVLTVTRVQNGLTGNNSLFGVIN